MSWRRGFFRLWIALSVSWAAFLYININPRQDTYTQAITDLPMRGGIVVPITATEDEIRTELLAYYRQIAPGQTIEESQIVSDTALVRAEISRMISWNDENRSTQWRGFVVWSIVLPAAVLALGAVVGWILSGFRARATKP